MPDLPANSSTPAEFQGIQFFGLLFKNYGSRFEGISDQDWIAIDVAAGGTYDLFASANRGTYDFVPTVRIVDANGNVLPSTSATLGIGERQVTFTAATTGRVYVSVESSSNRLQLGAEYTITATSRTANTIYDYLTSGDDSYVETAAQPASTNVWLLAGPGDDYLDLDQINRADGGSGDDQIEGSQVADLLAGGTGKDFLQGWGGGDTIWGDGGDDDISGYDGADRLWGGDGNDTLYGDSWQTQPALMVGGDVLDGGDGNDTLVAGQGSTLTGGAGNDTYVLYGAAVVSEAGPGAGGTDTLKSIGSVDLMDTDAVQGEIENIQLIIGPYAPDGDDSEQSAFGNSLANVIGGNGYRNLIDGRGGADAMAGRGDNDTYIVDNVGDTVSELAGEGTDEVRSGVSFTLTSNASVERLLLSNPSSTAGRDLTGSDIAQTLTGNAGVNRLDGRGGADTMQGLGGNDTYAVDSAGDRVVEVAGGGTDLIQSSVSQRLGASVENLVLTGSADIKGFGNAAANTIMGNTGANLIEGLGGRDNLRPGADTKRDVISVAAVSDSTGVTRDLIVGMDLNNEDRFDVAVRPNATILNVNGGTLSEGSFDVDISRVADSRFEAGGTVQAIRFDPNAGNLNEGGHVYVIIDSNNDGNYTRGADIVLELVNYTGTLDVTDFI